MRLIEFLLALVLVAIVVLLIGLFLPGQGHVERSIVIERPASHVFDLLNSYKRFNAWSPWAKKDPQATYEYGTAQEGPGASMSFSSANPDVGTGTWEILESTPTSLIKMNHKVDGGRSATVSYDILPTDLGVKVTWSYDTDLGMNPINRIRGLYLDSSIGQDYQYGLMRLKALLESSAYARDYSDLTITRLSLPAQPALKASGLVEVYSEAEFPDLGAGVADTFGKIKTFADRNKLNITGPAQVLVTLDERYRLGFDVVVPVDRIDVTARDGVEPITTTEGLYVRAEHTGVRRGVKQVFEKLQAYATIHGLAFDAAVKQPLQEFVTPAGTETPEEQTVTAVYLPLLPEGTPVGLPPLPGMPAAAPGEATPAAEPAAEAPAAEPAPAAG